MHACDILVYSFIIYMNICMKYGVSFSKFRFSLRQMDVKMIRFEYIIYAFWEINEIGYSFFCVFFFLVFSFLQFFISCPMFMKTLMCVMFQDSLIINLEIVIKVGCFLVCLVRIKFFFTHISIVPVIFAPFSPLCSLCLTCTQTKSIYLLFSICLCV